MPSRVGFARSRRMVGAHRKNLHNGHTEAPMQDTSSHLFVSPVANRSALPAAEAARTLALEVFTKWRYDTDPCQQIADAVRPVFEMLEAANATIAQLDAELVRILATESKLKAQVIQLQKKMSDLRKRAATRLSPKAAAQIWVCFKLISGCSYADMRLLARCEAALKGVTRNYDIPSEPKILAAYRDLCQHVDKYLVPVSRIFPQWRGHVVDLRKLFVHDITTHAKLINSGYHLKFKISYANKAQVRSFILSLGVDALPMTGAESWTQMQVIFDMYEESLGKCTPRLGLLMPYPDKHPAVVGVMQWLNTEVEALKAVPTPIKLGQRTKNEFVLDHSMVISDWAFRPVTQKSLPANHTAFSSYGRVSMANLSPLCGKRGDDPALELLSHQDRVRLGKLARSHYETVETEAKGLGLHGEALEKRMCEERLNFALADRSHINPQVDQPLEVAKHSLVEPLHAGLREVPRTLRHAHKLGNLLFENGRVMTRDTVPLALQAISSSSELTSAIKSLKGTTSANKTKGPGNMLGRMCDLVQANWGTIFGNLLVACGDSEFFQVLTLALFVIAIRHRDILGTIKVRRDISDGDLEFMLDAGREAFSVWWTFFRAGKPGPYQIAIEFEAPALLKRYIQDTGNRRVFDKTAQFVELGGKSVKSVAHRGNFVQDEKKVGVKRGAEFKGEWRLKTYQPFVVDYAEKVLALQLGLYTDGQLGVERESKHKIRPGAGDCKLCLHLLPASGTCSSVVCSHRLLPLVLNTAKNFSPVPGTELKKIMDGFTQEVTVSFTEEEEDFKDGSEEEEEEAEEKNAAAKRKTAPALQVQDPPKRSKLALASAAPRLKKGKPKAHKPAPGMIKF